MTWTKTHVGPNGELGAVPGWQAALDDLKATLMLVVGGRDIETPQEAIGYRI